MAEGGRGALSWPKYGGRHPLRRSGVDHSSRLAAAEAAAHRSPQGPARWLKAPPWAREEERPRAAAMPRSGVLWALRGLPMLPAPATVGQPAPLVSAGRHILTFTI